MPFCSKCGSKTAEGALYCEACGMDLRKREKEEVREKAPRRQNLISIGVLILIAVGILATLTYIYSTGPTQSKPTSPVNTPAPLKEERFDRLLLDKQVSVSPGTTDSASFAIRSVDSGEKNVRLDVYVSSVIGGCPNELSLYRGDQLIETITPIGNSYKKTIYDPGFETYTVRFVGREQTGNIRSGNCDKVTYLVSAGKYYEVG